MPKKTVLPDDLGDEPTLVEPDEPTNTAPEPEPEPVPGQAGYDWSRHYPGVDIYTHTFADGTVVALKTFASIYSKTWLYKIRDLATDADIEFAAIDRATCDEAKAVLRGLDDTAGDPLEELWLAWIAAGTAHADGGEGLTPGKSSA